MARELKRRAEGLVCAREACKWLRLLAWSVIAWHTTRTRSRKGTEAIRSVTAEEGA